MTAHHKAPLVLLVLSLLWASSCTKAEKSAPKTAEPKTGKIAANADKKTIAAIAGDCADLPQSLRQCKPFSCTFKHPMGGGTMKREVVGEKGAHCIYQETMPNSGLMTCKYDQSFRKAAAATFEKSLAGEKGDGTLKKAMTTGVCVVSGYQ